MAIKINWNKYKRLCLEWALTTGGSYMIKKIWKAICGYGKKEIIAAVKNQQDDLAKVIKTAIDSADPATLPERLSAKVIDFIVSKIEKI